MVFTFFTKIVVLYYPLISYVSPRNSGFGEYFSGIKKGQTHRYIGTSVLLLFYESTPVALQVNERSFETVLNVTPKTLYFIVTVP